MTPTEQEALSRKYSSGVAIILPLTTGEYAIFNAQRKLVAITFSLEEVALAIAGIETTLEVRPEPAKRGISLEDLGL